VAIEVTKLRTFGKTEPPNQPTGKETFHRRVGVHKGNRPRFQDTENEEERNEPRKTVEPFEHPQTIFQHKVVI